MSAMQRFIPAALFSLAILAGPAAAQRVPDRGERSDVRGVLKKVDAAAGTVTVAGGGERGGDGKEATYKLAADAEVVTPVGAGFRLFKAVKLADLAAGTTVGLALAADGKTVESVVADGPLVRGVLKATDPTKRTLTVAGFAGGRGEPEPVEKTYTLAADAEVGVDDGRGSRFSLKEAKLADIAPGGLVLLRVSVDGKSAESVTAEGPAVVGTVKAIDAGKRTVTIATPGGRGEEPGEKTLTVAADAAVLLDDGRGRRLSVGAGKLADVPAGATVQGRLSADGKSVTVLRAEGPTLPGQLKAVDAAKGTVTVSVRKGRGEAEEKTLPLAKGARVLVDGKPAAVGDLKPGDETFVVLRLSLDQAAVQGVTVAGRR